MWITTARFAHYLRCTNCSRQFCTEDYKDQAGFGKSYQTTDHLATYRLIEQKCHEWWIKNVDSDSWLHEGVRFHHPQVNSGRPQILQHRSRLHQPPEEDIQRPQGFCTHRRREQHFRDPKRIQQARWSAFQPCCSTRFFNTHWRTKFNDGKWKKEWVYTWATMITTASQTWDSPTTCCRLQHPKNRYGNCCVNSRKVLKKWYFRIHPDKTKILSNQSTINSDTKKQLEVDDMQTEILTRNESVKYLGQKFSFYHQETTEIKSRIRAAWATFHKYRQELTSKKYMLKLRLRLFDATVSPTVCYAAGTWVPNKEHERMIQSTQRKMLRLIIKTKRKYKKIEKQDIGTNEEIEEIDINEMCSTDDESGDGQSRTTHNDVDSEVSFEDDADDEIDTALIEEENWIEYKKKALKKPWKRWKAQRFDAATRLTKNDMEIGTENRSITEWKMAEQGCRMEPRIELKIQDQQSDWKTKKKMGRWHQRIPQTRIWRNWKPNRKQQSNQQNWDQHSQRPQKMGSTTRILHNDRRSTTEDEKKRWK